MINTISPYKRLFATLLTCVMSLIVISGIVFMHKEVTSKGEIITHIHPYDFTDTANKHTHKSDAEIQFLNVLFQGTYTESNFFVFEVPFFQEYDIATDSTYSINYSSRLTLHQFLRGPPSIA